MATRKESDNRDAYVSVLKSGSPAVAINLSAASSVRFIMRSVGLSDDDPPKVNAVATITDAVNGIVSYTFTTADLDTTGDYNIEWELHWSDGGIKTIPDGSDGTDYLSLTVVDDLG
jgi:hypothetical protein